MRSDAWDDRLCQASCNGLHVKTASCGRSRAESKRLVDNTLERTRRVSLAMLQCHGSVLC